MTLNNLDASDLLHTRKVAEYLATKLKGWFMQAVLRRLIETLSAEIASRGISEPGMEIRFITIFEPGAPTAIPPHIDPAALPEIDNTAPGDDRSLSVFADYVNTLDIDMGDDDGSES
jgi:hypothetical protein